ncbi:MAG: rod shape-determining protein RodA [Bacteroidota bacterium]
MRRQENIVNQIDWLTIFLYLILVLWGWLNIYAAVHDDTNNNSIFDLSINSGRQLIFIGASFIPIMVIMIIDFKFYDTFAYIFYGVTIVMLLVVLVLARDVSGARAWIDIGAFKLQPSEFAKAATALAVARTIASSTFKMEKLKNQMLLFAIIGLPTVLIILQDDVGTAMVYAIFLVVFYREGMSPILLIAGIVVATLFVLTLFIDNLYLTLTLGGLALLIALYFALAKKKIRVAFIAVGIGVSMVLVVLGTDFFINEVLQPHQRSRINTLVDPEADEKGAGYHVSNSKIAIGSGGFSGKGFLAGTQTAGGYVPEQSTDFIFATIGEEYGWLGSLIMIGLFITLLLRIIFIAERQKWRFARVYGYCVACILFFHFGVNIGMTIGLFPVIGIPLPFFSYGGSSLLGFTALLFILLKLDAHRKQVLIR